MDSLKVRSAIEVVDLFSGGGGGWCLGARALGLTSVGLEWDGPSCSTRAAAGLLSIRTDVATFPPERFAGRVAGITGGPPCQSFSSAGKRKGLADPRGQLIHQPIRWVRAVGPRWVALEQVPDDIDRPAPTVLNNSGGRWTLRLGADLAHDHCRDEDSIPVTIAELGVLQGFPADHPWQAPGRSAQVGNAIPPPLAEACLRAVAA